MSVTAMTPADIYARLVGFGFSKVIKLYLDINYWEKPKPNTVEQQQCVLDLAQHLLSVDDFTGFSKQWQQLPLAELDAVILVGYERYYEKQRLLLELSALPKLRKSVLGDIATDIDILRNHGDATVSELTTVCDLVDKLEEMLNQNIAQIAEECLSQQEVEMFEDYCSEAVDAYETYAVLTRYGT
jgi:hypothetical protein